jgi:inner membrane protein
LFPFSRQRFTLDWLFIIDPYLTALLLAGALAATWSVTRGRQAGTIFLAATAVYMLLCGFYHHQALLLARQVFPESNPGQERCSPQTRRTLTLPGQAFPDAGTVTIAALPQPFSPRRWQLVAANCREVRQSFVQLPYPAFLGLGIRAAAPVATQLPLIPGCRVPEADYRPPGDLLVQVWTGLPAPDLAGRPEAQGILNQYLEFARFPLLRRVEHRENGQLLEWLDLRFSIPGRDFPFVLQLRLDAQGLMQYWRLGRCGGEGG